MKRIFFVGLLSVTNLFFLCGSSWSDDYTAYFVNNSLQTVNVGLWDISGHDNTRPFTDGQSSLLAPGCSNKWTAAAPVWDNWWYECPPGMNRTFTSWRCTGVPYTFNGTNAPLHGSPLDDPDANSIDPINVMNGNVSYSKTDVSIPCPGIPLDFTRTYNSTLDYKSLVGQRWTHTYDWRVTSTNLVEAGNTNTYGLLLSPDKSCYWFKKTGSIYQSPLEAPWILQQSTDGTYQVTMPNSAVFAFNTNGMLQTMTDLWGNSLTLTYSNNYPNQLLTGVRHNNGKELLFLYTNNLISQVKTPSTNFNVYYYFNGQDELTNVTCTIPTANFSVSYLYDSATNWANHSLTQIVNEVGDVYSYKYATNAQGLVTSKGISMVLASNYYQHTVSYITQPYCQSTITYTLGNTNQPIVYNFDPFFGRVTGIAGPGTINHSTVFDMSGNPVSSVISDGAASNKTVRKFDACRNVTNMMQALNATPSNAWTRTWDTNQQVCTSVTDPEGHRMAFDYTNGVTTRSKLFYSASNSYDTLLSYTTNGLLTGVTNANGHWTRFLFDDYGNKTSTIPQLGPTVNYAWTQLGDLSQTIMPSSNFDTNEPANMIPRVISISRDERGRPLQITYPIVGMTEQFGWDAGGNLTNRIDTSGRYTRYTYKPSGKLASVSRQYGTSNLTTSFAFDQQFNTLSLTDAKGRTVERYTLDIQNRPIAVTNLEGQAMSISYLLGDYVRSVTRFDGTLITNTYTADGLLYQQKYPGSTNTFGYLKNGLMTTAATEQGTISNSFNYANRLVSSVCVAPSGMVPIWTGLEYDERCGQCGLWN